MTKRYTQILNSYDAFARSLRQKYVHAQYHSHTQLQKPQEFQCTPAKIYRRMRFLPTPSTRTVTQQFSGIQKVEHYIESTKNELNDHLPQITTILSSNVTSKDRATIKKLKQIKDQITIKPADKNLGIVLLNTDDYIVQCTGHLSDTSTYKLVDSIPTNKIRNHLTNTIISFKSQISGHSKRLYSFLVTTPNLTQTPQFYGIPKIHKQFSRVPPVRPIIAQSNSILNPTAKFIDHVLQPLAQSYPDYLHNSASLSLILQDITVPDDAILVTVDVSSLYPSIPQSEALHIIYDEMHRKRHLLPFDPNLIIQLLYTCINHNYFEFASLYFQQVKGTAMGAAFSPTIANIFMSVTLSHFLATQVRKPLLLVRYIDDIFMIWTYGETHLTRLLHDLNNFSPTLKYTHHHSLQAVDFLDLTIFKSALFPYTNMLDTKTFQKAHNLYQYLHYSSNHERSRYKAIITGELIRYVRTNTLKQDYQAMTNLLKTRLEAREYPARLVEKMIATVHYEARPRILSASKLPPPKFYPPLFKCIPPPQYKLLKLIVLRDYHSLQNTIPAPRFISTKPNTLGKELIRARISPTEDQLLDIYMLLDNQVTSTHTTTGLLPALKTQPVRTQKCKHPRCITCTHLNCSNFLRCTRTGITYTLRHNFSCTSRNLIYVITCTKCQKQYVGLTTQQLNVRINHHRSSIFNNKVTYLSKHFNLPDHSIKNLSVQAIDWVQETHKYPLQELRTLEKYWIYTLKTLQPLGLNVSPGSC